MLMLTYARTVYPLGDQVALEREDAAVLHTSRRAF